MNWPIRAYPRHPRFNSYDFRLQARAEADGVQVAPIIMSQRAAFAHGVIDGRTAQEFEPGGKAAEEVERLYLWLCGIVDMPTCRQVRKAA